MKELTLSYEEFREKSLAAAECFLWGDRLDYACWLTGEWKRLKSVESKIELMVDEGLLVRDKYGSKRHVYRLKGKRGVNKSNIKHGLVCTKALLLFLKSKEGEVISESFLRTLQFEVISEWGLRYEKTALYFEFSTADNWRRYALMTDKLRRYRRSMESLRQHFNRDPVVLFVYETSRAQVEAFVHSKAKPDDWAFYFIDLDTFWTIPVGQMFTTRAFISPVTKEPVGLANHA